ncbi:MULTISPECIES: flagellar assembly protein A [Campylobacter]|uniref:flagellar assembly protein A n=1 Tax=Campylobacter TaxID=194 RepID=UPI000A350407|nr:MULTISPECIES: flagellar assembly protein A [unclassified Campylobacter]MCR8678573.1 FapA family protein [Campylobacter sp. RM19072]MCR8696410.1 FapA family protein [Campylobacter sp. RM19073]
MVEDSKNPYQDIDAVSKSMGVPPEYLDFDILEIFTSYKNNQQAEFALAEDVSIFDDDEFFLDENLSIMQSYKVKFYDTREDIRPHLPKITLGANKYSTKVVATIKEDTSVKYTPTFEKELINTIYKKMLKAGFLIDLRCKDFKKRVSRLTSILRINEMIEKSETIVVATGIDPVLSMDGKLLVYYKNNNDDSNNDDKKKGRRDIDRGFLSGVIEGDLIMEYIKPTIGSCGRSLKGDIIPVEAPKNTEENQIIVSQNIKAEESEDHIKYIALKSGYVIEEGNKYDIKEEIDVGSVNLKSTGSITTSLDSDVRINIKESDYLSDAIGSGMKVETSEVRAIGNVAKDAVIKAKSVVIEGNTHAQSKIYTQDANISLHMGYLECDEAHIDRLEGGKIKAKKAYIGCVLGGDIEADEIYIKTLHSNSVIRASTLISIDELKGDNNRLIVDVSSILDQNGEVTKHHKKIQALEDELKVLPKDLEYKKNVIESNKNSINMIKNRLLEMRQEGITPPAAFLNKLKDFQGLVADYNQILKRINSKQIELATLKDELISMESIIFDAKIINRDRWTELNEIKFKLIEPPIDISYSTKENEIARVMTLKAGINGYEIKRSNEL